MRLRNFITAVGLASVLGFAIFWVVTIPGSAAPSALSGLAPDTEAGRNVFLAGGCASCHSAPEASGDAKLVLAGGRSFPSPFGTFIAPNISPSAAGIGDWSAIDLAGALWHGTAPNGTHYYPAFPYGSYSRMTAQDVVNLNAYLATLPPSDNVPVAHDVGFPFNIRRLLGGWKFLFASDDWVMPANDPVEERGRYLVEALGHCGECHTARNALGGLELANWLQGGPNPAGSGRIPDITPSALGWRAEDIVFYLKSGVTPDFDSVGGEMVDVIENLRDLPEADLEAIAAYLVALPEG